MEKNLFVLGVDDPEMREIEHLLDTHGVRMVYATKDGRRVHPGNAYQADALPGNVLQVVLVECAPAVLPEGIQIMQVDHHRPDDPGYGLPATQFWQASSLGQVCTLLGVEPTHEQKVLAAMDHAPAAAIRGECPGVTQQEVLERKIAEIAVGTKCAPEAVRERVSLYQIYLMDAPPVWIGARAISDLRDYYLGEGYSLELLAAQTAALADGYTVLLKHRDAPGKPEKWSISGHATPELIEAFMNEWAPAQGLTGIYGVPVRGYAGGYVPREAQ